MSQLQPGQKAPALKLKDQHGNWVTLKQFLGKKVLLFFYPEDDTPTCTTEACNLRDNFTSLQQHGIEVIGISPDNQNSHQLFVEKYNLPFILLSDPNHKALDAYGVWGEKNLYGHRFMGVLRTSFLINEEGRIQEVIRKVKSADHTQQVLKKWQID